MGQCKTKEQGARDEGRELTSRRQRAFWWYLASIAVFAASCYLAAQRYPGGFDWLYTVASALASQKHNPDGSTWFAGGLGLSMLMLWPYVSALRPPTSAKSGFAVTALRAGLICGVVLGLEKLLIRDLSSWVYKAHEILALLAFTGLYIGVIAMLVQTMPRQRVYMLALLLVVGPLVAIGAIQFWLYLDQRDLGWVDTSWREMGIPYWLSFAFWQWLAIGFLFVGLGSLSFTRTSE